jgi:hypothetical protein
MSRRDFDRLVEQRPPTRFYIILGIIAVAAILLAMFAIDCEGEAVAGRRAPSSEAEPRAAPMMEYRLI